MKRLCEHIKDTEVDRDDLAIFWISQAGFVYKTPTGRVIFVDPYLTDYVARSLPEYGDGFKRMTITPIEPEEVDADLVISTHNHPDHLDMDALPALVQNSRTHFLGAPDCLSNYQDAGVPDDRYSIIGKGETIDFGDFQVTGVDADHGELAPDALGIVLTVDGIRVWQVGDTAYRPEIWQDVLSTDIDVIIPPINGAFGNLDNVEAAKLAQLSGAKIAIPCHFWLFPLHNGNPMEFLGACKEHAPQVRPVLLAPGELFIVQE